MSTAAFFTVTAPLSAETIRSPLVPLWAFAAVGRNDAPLFEVCSRLAERYVNDFKPPELANTHFR